MAWLAVFIGGGIGSVLRYALALALPASQGPFPLGTLAANLCGCFLLGFLGRLEWGGEGSAAWMSEPVRLALTTGLCGGFTTYSTFKSEFLQLGLDGHAGRSAAYLFATLLLCAAGTVAGMTLGSMTLGSRSPG